MAFESLMTASVVIRSPLLEVFDYVANANNLPEWLPFYSDITVKEAKIVDRVSKGDRFMARLSVLPRAFQPLLSVGWLPASLTSPEIEVCVDDVVHGRRLAYRANTGWTNICDFEPSAGRTIFTVTQSMWSLPGLVMDYWMGPMQAFAADMLRRILEGLRRRLEGRAIEPQPRIFFSYRRSDARYVGGRIFDALTAEFGVGTVFRDSNSLLAGGDWADDIRTAVKKCRVVVVHIGDGWETTLQKRAKKRDGLRDELEAALSQGTKIRIVPVLTSDKDSLSMHERTAEIAAGVRKLDKNAPHICKKFTDRLQLQQLREDPDFGTDLEHLMRAVWMEFRSELGLRQGAG